MCRRVGWAVAVSFALAWSGCGDDLAQQSAVTSLRILAVAADPPAAAPGDRVVLTALWHSPEAEPPTFRWSHCPAPANGAIDRCGGLETELSSGAGVDHTSFLAPGDTAVELVRLTVCAVGADDGCAAGSDTVAAAKRVEIGTSSTPNTNPSVASFTVSLGEEPGSVAAITLDAAEGSVETTPGGSDEELFVSWFATAGAFEDDRSFAPGPLRFEGRWTPPRQPPADVQFWAVLRDGRGGITWAEQTVALP